MSGFVLSFFINLLFNAELLVMAAIAFLLHLFLDIPIIIVYILLGLWVVVALAITVGLGVLTRGTPPQKYQKNVNPYSKSTNDYIDPDNKKDNSND